jgi:hypothetical protein
MLGRPWSRYLRSSEVQQPIFYIALAKSMYRYQGVPQTEDALRFLSNYSTNHLPMPASSGAHGAHEGLNCLRRQVA